MGETGEASHAWFTMLRTGLGLGVGAGVGGVSLGGGTDPGGEGVDDSTASPCGEFPVEDSTC